MAITNLTGTKWTFNDTISLDLLTVGQIYYLNFKSNGKDYIGFQSAGGVSLGCVYNNGGLSADTAWTDEQWYNEALRTIEITDGADVENADFIAFLEANATQIKEPITQLRPFLKSIADSIRSKKGTTEPINAQNFASEIEGIETGGGLKGYSGTLDNELGTNIGEGFIAGLLEDGTLTTTFNATSKYVVFAAYSNTQDCVLENVEYEAVYTYSNFRNFLFKPTADDWKVNWTGSGGAN